MEWISANERLPETNKPVLAYCEETKKYFVGNVINYQFSDGLYWRHEGAKGKMYTVTSKVTHWMPLPEPPKEDQMPEITVKIPDGDYCEDCKFMEHYDYPLVDMMGNETGNRRSGYRCRQYISDLAVEDFGCYQKIKKCFWCTMSEEQRNAMAIRWLFLYGGFNKNKEKDDK